MATQKDTTSSTSPEGPVVFDWPDGTQKSNDQLWNAQQLVGNPPPGGPTAIPADTPMPDPLDLLSGKELAKVAKDEGVDITGLKTVGEAREAIRAARIEAETEAAAEAAQKAAEEAGQ